MPRVPEGRPRYTTAKVIVARAFPAPGQTAPYDLRAFDPNDSHGTHVAGIAAGDARHDGARAVRLGVAPRAYIGNYRALPSRPTAASARTGTRPSSSPRSRPRSRTA